MTRESARDDFNDGRGILPAPAGLAGIAGADAELPAGAISRGDDLAALAAVAPARSVHQAISCRPEDVRKPSRSNSVHRGFTPGADGSMHHGGSHHSYSAEIQKLGEQNEAARVRGGRLHRRQHLRQRHHRPPVDRSQGHHALQRRPFQELLLPRHRHARLRAPPAQKPGARQGGQTPPARRAAEWVVDSLREETHALRATRCEHARTRTRRVTAVLAGFKRASSTTTKFLTCSAPSTTPVPRRSLTRKNSKIPARRTIAEFAMHSSLHSSSRIAEPPPRNSPPSKPRPTRVSWAAGVVFETTRALRDDHDVHRWSRFASVRVRRGDSRRGGVLRGGVRRPRRRRGSHARRSRGAWEALVKDAEARTRTSTKTRRRSPARSSRRGWTPRRRGSEWRCPSTASRASSSRRSNDETNAARKSAGGGRRRLHLCLHLLLRRRSNPPRDRAARRAARSDRRRNANAWFGRRASRMANRRAGGRWHA